MTPQKFIYVQNMRELLDHQYNPNALLDIYGDIEVFYEAIFYNLALSSMGGREHQYSLFSACMDSDLNDIFEAYGLDRITQSQYEELEVLFRECCRRLYDYVDDNLFIKLRELLKPYSEPPIIEVKTTYSYTRCELIITFLIGS